MEAARPGGRSLEESKGNERVLDQGGGSAEGEDQMRLRCRFHNPVLITQVGGVPGGFGLGRTLVWVWPLGTCVIHSLFGNRKEKNRKQKGD